MKPTFRTKSITSKVTEEEYARLEELAAASGQSMSEWVREVLVGHQEQSVAKSHEDVLLGELLGLRAILLNLLFKVAKGEAMTEEQMKSLIAAADAGKMERARKLLAPACAAGVES
jgi:6-phosphofructokinase